MIATSLLGFAGWQAMRIAAGQRMIGATPRVKGPPVKVHSDGRIPLARKVVETDPVGAYIARSKRGMTEQEIRWMAADFRKLGLDRESSPNLSVAESLTIRSRQQEWYLAALVEGLSLSSSQKAQAASKLRALLQRDHEAISEKGDADITSFCTPIDWLKGSDQYAPWNLCDLTEAQISLTNKGWLEKHRASAAADNSTPHEEIPWISEVTRSVFDFDLGKSIDGAGVYITDLFRLPIEQVRIGGGSYMMGFVNPTGCQPCQLRMAFLIIHDLVAYLEVSDAPQPPLIEPDNSNSPIPPMVKEPRTIPDFIR